MNSIIVNVKKKKKYIVVEKITDAYYYLYRKCDRVRRFFRGLFINRCHIIKTHLPIESWYDSDTRILYGMMSVLVDFMEKERLECVDWESDIPHKQAMDEMKIIYNWWKDYPRRQKELSDTLINWHNRIVFLQKSNGFDDFISYLNKREKDEEEQRLSDLHDNLENKLDEEEQDMLRRLINVRRFMWT